MITIENRPHAWLGKRSRAIALCIVGTLIILAGNLSTVAHASAPMDWRFNVQPGGNRIVAESPAHTQRFSITPSGLHRLERDGAKTLGLIFVGADAHAVPRQDAPARVDFDEIYAGIDLAYYSRTGRLEYDLIVRPGADPRLIRLRGDGVEPVTVNANGDLVLKRGAMQLIHSAPVAYQYIDGRYVSVAARYVTTVANEFAFELGAYDRTHSLVIDPVIGYATTVPDPDNETAAGVVVDSQGNSYVLRNRTTGNALTVEVLKFNTGGVRVGTATLATELGTATTTAGRGIAIDSVDNIYVTGNLAPTATFAPTAGAYQTTRGGATVDAFAVKLTPNLAVVYATYLGGGGADNEIGYAIAVDNNGGAYVTGSVSGCTGGCLPGFIATRAGFQTAPGFNTDVFLVRIAPNGATLDYYTYFGGNGTDNAYAIAVDANGLAYITGDTTSTDLLATPATIAPLDNTCGTTAGACVGAAATTDSYVAVIDTAVAGASSKRYVSYIGGDGNDRGTAIALDGVGNIYVAGNTNSQGAGALTTTSNAFSQTYIGGNGDIFIVKFNLTPTLIYSSYFGGGDIETVSGIAVDSSGTLYLAGQTTGAFGAPFPIVNAVQPANAGGQDAFIAKLETRTPGTAGLLYSTYFGTAGNDSAAGIAVDPNGSAYLAATVAATTSDVALERIDLRADLAIAQSVIPTNPRPGDTVTYTLTITNLGADVASGVIVTDALPSSVRLASASASQGTCAGTTTVSCALGTLAASGSATVSLPGIMGNGGTVNTATVRAPLIDNVLANNTSRSTIGTFCARDTACTVAVSSGSGGGGSVDIGALLFLLGLYGFAQVNAWRRR